MNILIVDDEDIARRGIRTSLEGTEVRVVGECSNGCQALECIRKHPQIDLVLLDLNMPVMDGLQFLSLLDPSFNGKVVVLSSYDDLEHVKEAMKRGACDYFHKPAMSPRKIREMIHNVQVRESNSIREHFLHERTEQWIRMLIHQPSRELLDGRLHWLAQNRGHLYTILVAIEPVDEMARLPHLTRDVLFKWKSLQSFNVEFITWGEDRYLLLLSLTIKSAARRERLLGEQCHFLQRSLEDVGPLSFGVSGECLNPLDLHICVSQSEKALEQSFFTGPGSINFFGRHHGQRDNGRIQPAKMWEACQNLDQSSMATAIDEFLAALERDKDRQKATSAIMEVLFDLRTKLENTGFHGLAQDISLEPVLSARHFSDVRDYLKLTFMRVLNSMRQFDSGRYSPMVWQAKQYIAKHFAEEISLDDLASRLQANPSYLSRVFKEQAGVTISEQITALRIAKARELLRMPDLQIREVARRVGYVNERYFSRVFKSETGSTPSQYRRRNFAEPGA